MSTQTIIEQLCLVDFDFDLWSGKSKLDKKDIKLGNGGELPPEELASLGLKNLINPARLRPFVNLRARAERLCEQHGTGFLGGYAIPEKSADKVLEGLKEIKAEFDKSLSLFLLHYPKAVEEWVGSAKEYSEAVLSAALSITEVKQRFAFDFWSYKLNPVLQEEADKINSMAEGLGPKIISEVIEEAQEFFAKRLAQLNINDPSSEGLGQKSKSILIGLRNKLEGLRFLDSRFMPIVELLDTAISAYGKSGTVQGKNLYIVFSAILTLSSENSINSYINGQIDVEFDADTRFWASQSTQENTLVAPDDENVKEANIPADLFSAPIAQQLQTVDIPLTQQSSWF